MAGSEKVKVPITYLLWIDSCFSFWDTNTILTMSTQR